MKTLLLDGNSLTTGDVLLASAGGLKIGIAPGAKKRMAASRRMVDRWVGRGDTVYGVTTGFGELASVRIGVSNIERLQLNLIRSHAAGVGDPLPPEIVRAMMVLRVNALAKGFSGIRVETAELLVQLYNHDILPVIPSRGSVGSSGDLAPLAHLVLGMIGEGRVLRHGRTMAAAAAMKLARIKPVALAAKEGIALINGTQMMSAYGAIVACEAGKLCKLSDIVAAMSTEALRGSDTAFDDRIHALRPHPGQRASAANLRKLMASSEIRESHRYGDERVQDAYSIRCIPQVHGATRDVVAHAQKVLTIEINSATDNPLIIPADAMHLEGGNFHGQPVALTLDFLAIALAELANISERRIERMVNGNLSGLPKFLTEKSGLNSGLMIAQYTAASLVSENKVLAHPASVDSIPTSANQEDHNSMGSVAAHKLWQVLGNVRTVLAIELMVAAQALEFARIHPRSGDSMRAGKGVECAHREVRKLLPKLRGDRVISDDISTCLGMVTTGAVLRAVEKAVGPLK
jgi:histidine ammonia-lyase